jgi:hypothetical protein
MVRQIAHHKTYKHRNSNYQIHTIQHSKTQNNVQVSPEYSITKHISLTWYASNEYPSDWINKTLITIMIWYDMKFHSYIIYSILQSNQNNDNHSLRHEALKFPSKSLARNWRFPLMYICIMAFFFLWQTLAFLFDPFCIIILI